ncbi:MAG: NAD(+)/NADH kinase [Blastocatellia bacterium]|nr:NAD(+)/NADH kinase [Blastocatellia bacterium]
MSEKPVKSVAIIVKPHHDEARATAEQLSVWLRDRKLKQVGDTLSASDARREPTVISDADLIVVLGGDCTMISAARMVVDADVPILGVNYGNLGYLTDFRIEEMFSSLESIVDGAYEIDRRVMLDAELWRNEAKIASGRVLNDIVVNKAALARIIDIEVTLNDLFVNSFRADGLIVSTPTGSTAYNLSAGGPIVYPSMNAVVITPICPFTLTNRPLVVPDSATIVLTLISGNEGVALTLDGQTGFTMEAGDRVQSRKSATSFNLIRPTNRNYFDVLRDKLRWGR